MLSVSKNFFLHLWCLAVLPFDFTYCESVFRKSANENVEVFSTGWTIRNNAHFRIDTCGRSRSAYPYPISIRVWGIVSFIFQLGLSTTFIRINESQLHTFFVYTPISFGAEDRHVNLWIYQSL